MGGSWLRPTPKQFGNYSILDHIATGGMAEVYLARQGGLQGFEKIVVIKRAKPELMADLELTKAFLDEARLVATLQHPNIAQVYEIGIEDDSYFFVMEYVQGVDLRQLMQRAVEVGRKISVADAVYIAIQICIALHYAHEKRDRASGKHLDIIHRDVTPSNVLLSHEGAVKVCDFGIAKATNRTTETVRGAIKGKWSYMSPEQCRCEPLDRRSDVFAIGILLYEMSTLTQLFTGDSDFEILQKIVQGEIPAPSRRVPYYPQDLEKLVMKALSKDREGRFPTAQALQLELEAFARDYRLAMSSVNISKLIDELFDERMNTWVKERHAEKAAKLREGLGPQNGAPPFLPVGTDTPQAGPPAMLPPDKEEYDVDTDLAIPLHPSAVGAEPLDAVTSPVMPKLVAMRPAAAPAPAPAPIAAPVPLPVVPAASPPPQPLPAPISAPVPSLPIAPTLPPSLPPTPASASALQSGHVPQKTLRYPLLEQRAETSEPVTVPKPTPPPAPAAAPQRRPTILWIVAAAIAGASAIGISVMGHRIEADSRSGAVAKLDADAQRIATKIEQAVQTTQLRARAIATAPIIRAAIETDVATMKDVAEREYKLSLAPNDTVEMLQVRDGVATSLLRLPDDAPALAPQVGAVAKLEARGKAGLGVLVGEPIARQQSNVVVGEVALAAPIDLGDALAPLTEHTTSARLAGLGADVALVPGDGDGATPERIALRTIGDVPAGSLVLVATLVNERAGWVGPATYIAACLAGLLLMTYAMSWWLSRSPDA